MPYHFRQFSRHAQIEQYLFSIPMILTTPEQPFPVAVRALPYLHKDLKSRKLMTKKSLDNQALFILYENAPSLYPSPSTGEGGVGVIFILRCARPGHGS